MANAPVPFRSGRSEVVERYSDHVEVVEDRGADGGDAHDLTVLGWFFRCLVVHAAAWLPYACPFQPAGRRALGGIHLPSEAAVTLAMYSTLVAPLMRSLGLAFHGHAP